MAVSLPLSHRWTKFENSIVYLIWTLYPFIPHYLIQYELRFRDFEQLRFSSFHRGVLFDLLWSDPSEDHFGWKPSPREAGYTFGNDVTQKFNRENSISLIVRGHQMVMNVHLV